MKVEAIAHVVHEANRAIQLETGDPAVSPHWTAAPRWQRQAAIEEVRHALDGASPEQLHNEWCAHKRRDGWVYGPVKDGDAKTHPCLVPYDRLPPEQTSKHVLFTAIVNALKDV
jgi:RyR domain